VDQTNGLFGWVDLVTGDVATAKDFYTALFGWTTEDMPTPMGPSYTMCRNDGKLVAGIGPQPPDLAAAGVPSSWNSYVLVEDIDAVCAAVPGAGGTVVMPTMDVMTQGRMAMVADPSGAVVGMWQPGDHQGAELYNVPGALTWNELQTRDLAAATPFYEQVFGWRWEDSGDGSGYLVAQLDAKPGDDKSNGGAMAMPPGVPDQVPSFWGVYFAVADCDASLATALGLGAVEAFAPMEMGPMRFAGLHDPTGAMFMIVTFTAA
jgi:predicted enzyme related to lactoylglutathione lyase